MPTVRIQVAGTEGPQAGRKRGRIKDTSGTLYQALPSFLGMVQIGGTYDLVYKDDEFNGAKFRVVEGVTPAIGGAPTPAARQAPAQTSEPQREAYSPQASGINKDEMIFVEALIKPWMEKVPVGDRVATTHAVEALRGVFWDTFGKYPNYQASRIQSGYRPVSDEEFPP